VRPLLEEVLADENVIRPVVGEKKRPAVPTDMPTSYRKLEVIINSIAGDANWSLQPIA